MKLYELEKQKDRLLKEIQGVGDMRSGSLSVRYQRCSKSPCVCDDPKHPGHGPIYSFSTDEFVEYREKSLLTVLGDVSVNRAYYYDKACPHENKADEFGKRIYGEAMRRGLQRAEKICVIGDGAPWIWNIADEQFYGDIQIIDLYHARDHCWNVARVFWGNNKEKMNRWAKIETIRDALDS